MSRKTRKRNQQPLALKQNTLSTTRNNQSAVEKMALFTRSQHFEGPLPPPQILADYDQIVPGCAEKIIDQFVIQGTHRMSLEKLVISNDIKRANWGLAAGFTVTLVCLGAATYLALQGKEALGIILGGGSLASLVGVFIYGTTSRRRERAEKAKLSADKK